MLYDLVHHGVYLRVCGGIALSEQEMEKMKGLSPRVRRHQQPSGVFCVCARSISACAEASDKKKCDLPDDQVYLRVCGGIRVVLAVNQLHQGLSPRVRRHPLLIASAILNRGSISACAEASILARAEEAVLQVYLRVCGGIRFSSLISGRVQGLSPRVRRHHEAGRNIPPVSGSISACAEASCVSAVSGVSSSVYLRVCGGILQDRKLMTGQEGLSPRVRRHLKAPHLVRMHKGSISACAEASGA